MNIGLLITPPSFKFLFRLLQHIVFQKLDLVIRRKPLVCTKIQVVPINLLQSMISDFLILAIWQMIKPTMMNNALYINGRAVLAQYFISQENLVYLCPGEVLSQTLMCQSKKHSQDCSVLYCHSSTLSLIRQSGVASITDEGHTILCCVSFSRNWLQMYARIISVLSYILPCVKLMMVHQLPLQYRLNASQHFINPTIE